MKARKDSLQAAVATIDGELMKASERRVAERKVICLRAKVELPNGVVLIGHSTDISRTGIGLFSPSAVQVGHECRLSVDLSACGTQTELKLTGRVCYCTEQAPRMFRLGMHFVGTNAHAAALLDDLLR